MKRSPIQLLRLTLIKIAIEPVENGDLELTSTPFDFDKVPFQTSKSIGKFPAYWEGNKPPLEGLENSTYHVALGVRTPPDKSDIGPYKFEIVYAGVIAVLKHSPESKISERDMALQYGLTLLWGAVREQLSTLTHKMPHGAAMLPTMSFMDEKDAVTQESVRGNSLLEE